MSSNYNPFSLITSLIWLSDQCLLLKYKWNIKFNWSNLWTVQSGVIMNNFWIHLTWWVGIQNLYFNIFLWERAYILFLTISCNIKKCIGGLKQDCVMTVSFNLQYFIFLCITSNNQIMIYTSFPFWSSNFLKAYYKLSKLKWYIDLCSFDHVIEFVPWLN